MMSAYRELKDTTELDLHIETCASCREALANYTRVGENLRSAPVFAPPQDAHTKLMQALADEHLKMLQKSAHGKLTTPEFLKPYLRESAQDAQTRDDMAAFSSAETGPLPLIHARRKRRQALVNQFAVLGLAAAILIMLMMGGLTSLFMLAPSNPSSITKNSVVSLAQQAEVDQKTYTSNTPYPNVVSAIPNGNFIYYTASGSGENTHSWMLIQFDRNAQISKPLLDTPSSDPLIVLATSDTWLIFLEFDRPQPITHGSLPDPQKSYSPERAWNLFYLSLLPQSQSTAPTSTSTIGQATTLTPTHSTTKGQQTLTRKLGTSTTQNSTTTTQSDVPDLFLLSQGIFDSSRAPSWATSPIQGVWLIGDMVLVTQIDQRGISHLDSYLLGQDDKNTREVEIARADPGHILTWPAADSTGTQIFWAEEWFSGDGMLHSNIWERQAFAHNLHYHGYPDVNTTFSQTLLMSDGLSFQPQVVGDTLFFMSTSEAVVSNQGANQTPNGTPFPDSATDASVSFTPRTNLDIYPAPVDASVHGTIFMIPLDGPNIGNESMLGTVGQSTGFQAGNSFVIWQDNTGYKMYDVVRQAEVLVGDTLNSASLLAVNANTTLWLTNNEATASSGQLTIMAYSWPG